MLLHCAQGRFLVPPHSLIDLTAQLLVKRVSPRRIPCRTMNEALQSVDQSHAAEPRDNDSSARLCRRALSCWGQEVKVEMKLKREWKVRMFSSEQLPGRG